MSDLFKEAAARLAEIPKEIQSLESEAEKLREFLSLRDAVSRLLKRQGDLLAPEAETSEPQLIVLPPLPIPPPLLLPPWILRPGASMKDQVLAGAHYLLERVSNIKTPRLIEILERSGVSISGANKLQTVSSLLSKDPHFKADRRSGWKLVTQSGGTAPTVPPLSGTPAM